MKIIENHISDTWLKAAVMGSIWAANEIILGSFLHNLRVPLSGTFMAFLSVAIMVSFSILWKDKFLIIKAGLIAALMKSISPSAIILGPMVGIILEAAFLQFFVILFGKNLLGFAIGGAFAVSAVLFQKVGRLLISYGMGFLEILENIYKFAVKQLHLTTDNPTKAVLILLSFYAFWGITAAAAGFVAGKKAKTLPPEGISAFPFFGKGKLFEKTSGFAYSSWLLLANFVLLVGGMILINRAPVYVSLAFSGLYIAFVIKRYRNSIRRLRRPVFWIWFVLITFLAALFLDNSTGQSGLSTNGMIAGLLMNLRAALVLFSFAAISTELKNPLIKSIMYRRGAAAFYQALEVAFGILPAITEMFPEARKLLRSPVKSMIGIITKADRILDFVKKEYRRKCKVLIISGNRQQGKTTFVKKIIENYANIGISGFYTEIEKEEKEIVRYFLVSVENKEKMLLCSNDTSTGKIQYGRFYFNEKAVEKGVDLLRKAAKEEKPLVVIDEVGPLEVGGKGWSQAIDEISKHPDIKMIWTVRKSLAEKAARRWDVGKVTIIDLREKEREEMVRGFLDD